MNVSYFIARRYLFSKKSRNIINLISAISMVVVAGITMAMVIVLSFFNGIDLLVKDLFSTFSADIVIQPVEGRTIEFTENQKNELLQVEGVVQISEIIEEDAWIRNSENNTVATVKGVEDHYASMSPIDSMMWYRDFALHDGQVNLAVAGLGVYAELDCGFPKDGYDILTVNAPIRGKKLRKDREKAFKSMPIHLGSVYSVNAELDVKYLIVPLDFAKELYGFEGEISAIEIQVDDENAMNEIKERIAALNFENARVKTRFEQNALIFQTTASEKWAVSLILLFILVIAAFNIIASLTMLIIEKKKDIFILRSFGTKGINIHRIFILEGVLIYTIGAAAGIILGILACLAQQKIGVIPLEGSMVEYYPVDIQGPDLLKIVVSVMTVGILFSILLVRYLVRRFA